MSILHIIKKKKKKKQPTHRMKFIIHLVGTKVEVKEKQNGKKEKRDSNFLFNGK